MAPVVTAALGALGPLLGKLTDLLANGCGRLKGVRREIRSLWSEFASMYGALSPFMVQVIGDGDICVLYVIDVKERTVRTLYPTRNCEEAPYLRNKQLSVMKRLLHGLCRCIDEFFEGWSMRKEEFSFLSQRLMHENALKWVIHI
ncbi:hypothetical protein ACQ4PT_032850 [Festuca glaucescens]